MIRNRGCKMVVLLATALALGAGAVAACIIPWFYCKPPDADDETREATGTRDGTDPGSHFQSAVDENLNPATNIRINGISYVRVVVPPNSSSNHSTIPTSTMLDSATLNAVSLNHPVNEELRHQDDADNGRIALQPSVNADLITSGLPNSEIPKEVSRNVKSAVKLNDSKVIVSNPEDSQPSETDFANSGVSHSGFINSDIVGVRVLIKDEENAPARLPSSETSNPSSEPLNFDSIRACDTITESKEIPSLIAGSSDPQSSALTSSTRTEEESSTRLAISDPSNPTDESSTGTTNRTSTSQESDNSSSGPTKVLTIAVVESTKMSDLLETIQEVSTSPAASPTPKHPQQSDLHSFRFNRTPYPWVGNEESITSTSTRACQRTSFRSDRPNRTPSVPGTPGSTQSASKPQDTGIRKTFRGSRYVEALSGRIKKIWRGIKIDTTPRNGRNKHVQQPDTMKSFSAGKKCPAGHSTLISEDQRLLDTIRTRRSPRVLHACLLKTFEDPGIPINNNSNFVSQFGIEGDEEPLDLSIRSSPERGSHKTADMSTGRKRLNLSGDSCKEAFRGVAECLKVRKSSKSSEDVISVSDSLKISNGISNVSLKDENQNVRSDFPQAGNVKIGDNASTVRDLHAEKSGRSCLPKSNRFPRGIKKILHLGGKDRSKRSKLSSPVHQEQVSNSAPVKCLENPVSTSSHLKCERNVTVIRTPDSCTDMSSYFELGVAKSDDDRYPDEPCTEL